METLSHGNPDDDAVLGGGRDERRVREGSCAAGYLALNGGNSSQSMRRFEPCRE